MSQKQPLHEELWFRWKDVGIKTFCRVGSGTIQREITTSQGYELFMDAPKKVCLVRHPWDRLLSVWHGLWPGGTMPSRGYPPCKTLDQLIAHLYQTPDDKMEVHTKPMTAQLSGLWIPDDDELITMEAFFEHPPYGIPKPAHKHHASPRRVPPMVEELSGYKFCQKYYQDMALFRRAEKSPLVTGGNKATDSHEE